MNATKKTLIFGLVFLSFSCAAAGYMWFSLSKEGESLSQNMVSVRDKDQINQRYKALREMLISTASDRSSLERRVLSDERAVADLLSEFDSLATALNIKLSTKQLQVAATDASDFNELVIELEFKGDDKAVGEMLRLLENLPYKSRINYLSSTRTTDTETGIVTTTDKVTLLVSIRAES